MDIIISFSAAYVLLTTLVLADLFGPEKFANSFGLLLLFQGVATIIGPPIVGEPETLASSHIMFFIITVSSGFMFDAYNSYNEGLILMGAFIALSGLMLYPIPCIRQALEKVLNSINLSMIKCSLFIFVF